MLQWNNIKQNNIIEGPAVLDWQIGGGILEGWLF